MTMKVSYYPGCTLKTKGMNLEKSALATFDALGIEWEELPRWNCCGAVYSLADDDLIHMVAPVRDMVRAKELGNDIVMTLCSMCYNTLARANELMKNDEEKRNTINDFMDEEPDYNGELKVMHFLGFLRDEIGWESLKAKVKVPLDGLKVAPYYGCTLLRPKDVALDSADNPTLFNDFIDSLGGEVVDFPSATTCCGSYQVLANPDAALQVSHEILSDATAHSADVIVLTCPLCDYNLGRRQDAMLEKYDDARDVPILYFTQILAVALGVDPKECCFELNRNSTVELLEGRNLIQKVSA
jgi:heterodisulfide reductase subunit B